MSTDPTPERTVTISLDKYMLLFRNSRSLGQLQAHGVDNWDGYGEVDWDQIEERCQAERDRIAALPPATVRGYLAGVLVEVQAPSNGPARTDLAKAGE